MNEKPRFKVPYCKYCNEYATRKQLAPPDYVTDGPLEMQQTRTWELVCKDHERNLPLLVS